MSVMDEVPAWKRPQKWSEVSRAIEEYRALHGRLEKVIDDPAKAKTVMVEIKRVQEWLDSSLAG